MTYSKKEFPKLMQTAGKITILTALTGVLVFIVAFMFDIGAQQLSRVSAATSTASTTLTVLNTPPQFTLNAYEVTESSTSTPTNSGTAIQWRAIGSDSNGAPYFLLICNKNASPTANAAINQNNLGTARPTCHNSAIQWGVSAAASSGVAAIVSTTTLETGLFASSSYYTGLGEKHSWFAWVCDDDPVQPRCNQVPTQGYSATNSSPYHINKRPVLDNSYNNGPRNPGAALTFFSTSSDPDSIGGEDNIYVVVCKWASGINTTTRTCTSTSTDNNIASTSGSVTANATAIYNVPSIMRDQTYGAYTYLVDQHGHTATANPQSNSYTVNNVAPTVLSGDISLNGGQNMYLTVEADETTGFTLSYTARDANSCVNTSGTAGSEFNPTTPQRVAVFRADLNSTTTCNGTAGTYDPNDCYPQGIGVATWNLVCTASTTSCTGATDDTMVYNCTFPLWFVADPTDSGVNTPAAFSGDHWTAGVIAIDDDNAESAMSTTSSPVELISFTALDLLTSLISYGSLEPGQSMALTSTTTILSVGNTGLDQLVNGESMCGTFSIGNECDPSATSTVPESKQKFSSSSVAYNSVQAVTLSSTTNKEVELNVNKTTSTSSPTSGVTYWGIEVPGTITLAGVYTGLNTFIAKTAEAINW
ncbi:MAG: hypothetical protein RLZZ480_87 [Candidatus Parcubacteria bacterium]|jgi:hypothetical protein